MIICKQCGYKNDDSAEFCANDGAYLEWQGQRIADHRSRISRILKIPEAFSPPEPEPVVATPAPARPGPPPPLAMPGERVASLPFPPAPPRAVGEESRVSNASMASPVLPDEERLRIPAPPREPATVPEPNDVRCAVCGTGNASSRYFCRSCGASLNDPAQVKAMNIPWWRRLIGREPGVEAQPITDGAGTATEQPPPSVHRGAQARKLLRVAVVALGAAVAFGLLGPWKPNVRHTASQAYASVRNRFFPTYVQVFPAQARADSRLPGHSAPASKDGYVNTFWAEGEPEYGKGVKLTITFRKPVTIDAIGFRLGDQEMESAFATEPVPKTVAVAFFGAKGRRLTSARMSLSQVPDLQTRNVHADGVMEVEITLVDVWPAENLAGLDTAITEVQFFRKG